MIPFAPLYIFKPQNRKYSSRTNASQNAIDQFHTNELITEKYFETTCQNSILLLVRCKLISSIYGIF